MIHIKLLRMLLATGGVTAQHVTAKINPDPIVLSYVRGLKLEFLKDLPVQKNPMPEIRLSEHERIFIRKELSSLLKMVIVKG